MPSWRNVLTAIGAAWDEQREEIRGQAGAIVERLRGAAALKPPEEEVDPASLDAAVAGLRKLYDPEYGGFGGAPEVPALLDDRVPARARRARDGAPHAAPDGQRRHVRPGRRRLRALLGRPRLARPALREDALRQRAARPRVPARAGRSPASRCSSAWRARRSTGRWPSCARRRARSPPRWTPTPRASRASSTSGPSPQVREVLGDELADEAIEHFGMTEAGQLRGREHPGARDARPAAPRRAARAGSTRRARSACGRGSTTSG